MVTHNKLPVLLLEALVALSELVGHQFVLVPLLLTCVQLLGQNKQGLFFALQFTLADQELKIWNNLPLLSIFCHQVSCNWNPVVRVAGNNLTCGNAGLHPGQFASSLQKQHRQTTNHLSCIYYKSIKMLT